MCYYIDGLGNFTRVTYQKKKKKGNFTQEHDHESKILMREGISLVIYMLDESVIALIRYMKTPIMVSVT